MSDTDRLYKIQALPQQRLWGTQSLSERFGPKPIGDPYGEIFLCSAMREADSLIEGIPFSEFYQKNQKTHFGIQCSFFPLRINLIESAQALSIQVHPDGHLTKSLGYPQGIHEGWVILNHEPKASIVLGHTASDQTQLKAAIKQGTLSDHLNTIKVKNQDFFYLPPGTVHAIGKGLTVYEITVNLDITYRVYDYDRIQASTGQKRQLHIDEALQVITFPQTPQHVFASKHHNPIEVLFDQPDIFSLERWVIQDSAYITLNDFYIVTIIEGQGKLNGISVKPFETYLIPKSTQSLHCEGQLMIMAATYRETQCL